MDFLAYPKNYNFVFYVKFVFVLKCWKDVSWEILYNVGLSYGNIQIVTIILPIHAFFFSTKLTTKKKKNWLSYSTSVLWFTALMLGICLFFLPWTPLICIDYVIECIRHLTVMRFPYECLKFSLTNSSDSFNCCFKRSNTSNDLVP